MKAKANAPVSSSSLTVLWTAALIALPAITPTAGLADQHAATASDTRVADISLADLDLSTPEGLRAARDRLARGPPRSFASAELCSMRR